MGVSNLKNNKDDQTNTSASEVKETSRPTEIQADPVAGVKRSPPEKAKSVMSCVYGPIGSWRFGRALGIDLLCTEERTCNFDCVYCRFPGSGKVQTERQEFVSLAKVFDDINAVKGISADWAVFAGMGEPTLATNLGDAIAMVKSVLGLPVAVMTNGSFIKHKEVRKALSQADMVVLKLDAFDDNSFKSINRPSEVHSLGKMLHQWQMFRVEYKGKLAVSIMLSDLNKGGLYNLQFNTMMVLPDQVQMSTPLQGAGVNPLSRADYDAEVKQWTWKFKEVINALDAKVPAAEPLNAIETEKRHPSTKNKPEKAGTS